jgi:putative oxidoreductase
MLASIRSLWNRAIALLHKIDWAGPLAVRVIVGLAFAFNGWGKLHSLDDITAFFDQLHIPAPGFHAAFVSTIEFAGGIALVLGFGTRIAAALLVGVMTVAFYTAKLPELHGFDGFKEAVGTIELTYLAIFVWLVIRGAGAVSLDRLLARRGETVGVAA